MVSNRSHRHQRQRPDSRALFNWRYRLWFYFAAKWPLGHSKFLARRAPLPLTSIPNNSSAKRITVQIPTSSGDAIEAWVYLSEGSGPHPAVVMAHGIGGIKAGGAVRAGAACLSASAHSGSFLPVIATPAPSRTSRRGRPCNESSFQKSIG
jgi:hypothetical protein